MIQPGRTPIFLIGLMGAGKTTVGPLLASVLGSSFVDLDQEIVRGAQRTIGEIFQTEGESGFRQREAAALKEAIQSRSVIAVGGGAPAFGDNLQRMLEAGPVIYLRASLEELGRRLLLHREAQGRPLLARAVQEGTLTSELALLLEKRQAFYQQADLSLDVSLLTKMEVADRLSTLLANYIWPNPRSPVFVDPLVDSELRAVQTLKDVCLRGVTPSLVALITDQRVAGFHLERYLRAFVDAGLKTYVRIIPEGEKSKSLAELGRSAEALLTAGVDRSSMIVALGGGVVSDFAGFLAATLHRGLPWVAIATTLLSQVDAAIGGKTAVNLSLGKNLLGAFHSPSMVYMDLQALHTLPEVERLSGLGEIIKHTLLLGEDSFAHLEAPGQAEAARNGEARVLLPLIRASCAYKAQVVQKDPEERNPLSGRILLNLGHTVGHALEIVDSLPHGIAVSLGILAAVRVAGALGHREAHSLDRRLRALYGRLGLPQDLDRRLFGTETPTASHPLRPQLLAAMTKDKKREASTLRFVVPLRLGQVEVVPLPICRLPELLCPG